MHATVADKDPIQTPGWCVVLTLSIPALVTLRQSAAIGIGIAVLVSVGHAALIPAVIRLIVSLHSAFPPTGVACATVSSADGTDPTRDA
jgi:hypothetical protein